MSLAHVGCAWPALLVGNRGWYAVLVCYLDDSGEASEPIITLAGLVTSADCWLSFESEARSLFDDVGISYLHTVELHHRRGEFGGWNSSQTADFANILFRQVEKYIRFSVEFSVLKSRFQQAKQQYGLKKETSPMGMCFRGVVDRIVKDNGFREAEKNCDLTLLFVVESGHANNQDVLQKFNAIKKIDPNRFGSLVFEGKKERIALQVADFIAFYSRRIRNSTEVSSRKKELEMFQRILGDIKHRPFLATDFGV